MQVLGDFNTSVSKALSEIDPKWRDYDGLIVCGTHAPSNVEMQIDAIKEARESGKPFLGICFGHQLAAIEYARNVLGIRDATSEELSDRGVFVVFKLPQLKIGLHYDTHNNGESYWNNYEVNPLFLQKWLKPDNFITCQYHPEYQSSKYKPHPLLVQFLNLCAGK